MFIYANETDKRRVRKLYPVRCNIPMPFLPVFFDKANAKKTPIVAFKTPLWWTLNNVIEKNLQFFSPHDKQNINQIECLLNNYYLCAKYENRLRLRIKKSKLFCSPPGLHYLRPVKKNKTLTPMKQFLLIVLSIFTLSAVEAEEKKNFLDILKEKNIITPAEYDNYKDEMAGTAEMNTARAAADTSKAFKPRIEFHGMGHFAYWVNDAPQLPINNSFELVRAAIYGGAYLTRNIDFFTLYYFQPDAIQRVHELFGRWRIIPEFGIRAGLMKNPLTFENNVSSLVLQTIDYAQSISALTGLGSDVICDRGPSSGRDLGAEVFGSLFKVNDHRLLDYRLGVFNGAGIQYLRDNNNRKDIAGSLTLQPIKGNHISGGFYIGEGHYTKKGDVTPGDYKRNRWTLGLLHDSKHFYGRAEYIRGIDDLTKRHGFYALGIYHPLPQIDITLVYDWYNDDIDVDNTSVYIPGSGAPAWCDASTAKRKAVSMKYSIGGTYRFTKRIRVQAFYTFTQNDAQTYYTENTNKAIVQLELGF